MVVCAFTWIGFDADTRAKFTIFQRRTMLALGLLAFAIWYALVRSRVVAQDERLVVVNGYRRHEFDYAQVVAVHLPPGAPWATLDLADGTHRGGDGHPGLRRRPRPAGGP